MKTLSLTLSVSLLFGSLAVNAKDILVGLAGQKPMLLCYATTPRPIDRVDAEFSRVVQEEEVTRIETHSEPDRIIAASPLSKLAEPNAETVEPSFASRGLHLNPCSSDVLSHRDRAKFCMGNLLEGSLYDFKKKNDLHFEIASPTQQVKENSSMVRYDSFNITFLIRFNL